MNERESVVLCEGYHDRAYWQGWLLHLGCVDPGAPEKPDSDRKPVYDPREKKVRGRQFGFRTPTGRFIRVVVYDGRSNLERAWKRQLKDRAAVPLQHLVLTCDGDCVGDIQHIVDPLRRRVQDWFGDAGLDSVSDDDGDVYVPGEDLRVSFVVWHAPDEHVFGPTAAGEKQTLERLVCAAIGEAYPDRRPLVEAWLGSRPPEAPTSPKSHAWSHMAGWYADAGCEAFYRLLWGDEGIVKPLKHRLEQIGAWRVAELLAD
jgi:hypothetical protein